MATASGSCSGGREIAEMTPHFLVPLLKPTGPQQLRVRGRDGAAVATVVEGAFDSETRKRGLLGRTELVKDSALIIAPCGAIHTFGMQFPIDVLFTSRDGEVLKIRRAIPAARVASCLRAFAAVEMAAGEAERHDVKVGDVLELSAG